MACIDRDFWLDFAKESIVKAIETREKAADKLDTFLMWLWGIYTGIFTLASLLNYVSSDVWQLIFVAPPVLIIMISRFFCLVVAIPGTQSGKNAYADPNVVASIIDSYQITVEKKRKQLLVAKIAAFISILSICLALFGYNYFDPDKSIKQKIQAAKLNKELKGEISVPVRSQQNINDSLRLMNEYYDLQFQIITKQNQIKSIQKDLGKDNGSQHNTGERSNNHK